MRLFDDFSCPSCGSETKADKTTHTVDLGSGVVVVRSVPAAICTRCGDEWLGDETVQELERIVEEARKRKCQAEIVDYQERISSEVSTVPV